MKQITRILCLLLALLMLLPMAIACRKEEEEAPETETQEVTQTETETETEIITDKWGQVVVDDGIPDELDYGGKTVNVLIRSGEQYRYEWNLEKPQTSVDQEIYYRNLAVAEELGITWNFVVTDEGTGLKTINEKILNTGKSGLGGIDIVNNYRNGAANTNLIPFYMDVRSDKFTYLNLDQPYWSKNINEAAESFGRQYFFAGDMNLSLYDRAIVVFFNKTQLEPSTGMTVDQLYQTVLDGDWTYEKLYNMTKGIYEDTGKTAGVRDYDDFYGISSIWISEASDGLLYAWDLALSEENEDGTHRVVTETGKTKMIEAFDKLTALLYGNGAYLNRTTSMDNIKHFTQGHAVFNIDVLYHFAAQATELAAMEDGYGVVPTPKYDDNQTEYYSGMQDAHNIMSVMYYGLGNYEMISAVLELTASKSYETVRPFYVETVVKGQRLDANSGKCFELIMAGVTLDWTDIYEPSIGSVRGNLWRTPFKTYEEGGSVVDAFASKAESINEKIATIDEWLVTHY